jgi:hypothetical protein
MTRRLNRICLLALLAAVLAATAAAQQAKPIANWVNLKPSQPTQRFCKAVCRFQFSRNGSAILQLKERIAPEVRKQMQLEIVCPACNGKGTFNPGVRRGNGIVVCEKCINGRVLTPFGRDVLRFVTSGHVEVTGA